MPRLHRGAANKVEKFGLKARSVARGRKTISVAWLQPWFLSKPISAAIRRLIPRQYESRMYWYFEDFGCFMCKKKNVLYAANGFCLDCMSVIRRRLKQVMKRRKGKPIITQVPEPKRWFFSRAAAAEKLLREFVKKGPRKAVDVSALHPLQPRPRRYR